LWIITAPEINWNKSFVKNFKIRIIILYVSLDISICMYKEYPLFFKVAAVSYLSGPCAGERLKYTDG
jgi:hypothetical protein